MKAGLVKNNPRLRRTPLIENTAFDNDCARSLSNAIWVKSIPLVGLAIVAVAIYTLWMITKSKKSGYPLQDERTIKISGKAYQAGFTIGAIYLISLNFYNIISIEFLGGEQLESMLVINSVLIIMGLTVIVVKTYLERKEDI
ncbi:hypothetical protein JW865_02205 [Candidatus Bathyarchaeota archaeon]|nr:hypothetical protein [Candidatus Bathyarchaeota archaeon]